jgi:NitT/TauT family transport system substrate-binding protein
MRRLTLLALITVLAMLATACNGNGADDGADGADADADAGADAGAEGEEDAADGELTAVRFGVATQAQVVSLSPYTAVPQALGYFEEEGLDVEILGFAGGGGVVEALDAGQIDVGIPPATSVFAAANVGADIVTYYTQITGNYLLPHVPEDSDIETVLDLEGTTIGSQSLQSANIPMIRAMLASEGGDPDSVEFIATGGPAEAGSFLETGQLDAVALWDAAHAQLINGGLPLREITNEQFSELGFHQGLIVERDRLESDREMLVGLGRAISKGMAFADENPEAAIEIYWEEYPDSRPAGVSDEEAMEQALLILEARAENTEPVDDTWGLSTEEQVREHVEAVNDVEGYDLSVEDVWTDELIEEINDFDEEAVREEARNWSA